MKLKGTGIKELKKLERELQSAIRSTGDTIVKEEARLRKLRQDYSQARLRSIDDRSIKRKGEKLKLMIKNSE